MPALSMREGNRRRVIPNFVEEPWALMVLARRNEEKGEGAIPASSSPTAVAHHTRLSWREIVRAASVHRGLGDRSESLRTCARANAEAGARSEAAKREANGERLPAVLRCTLVVCHITGYIVRMPIKSFRHKGLREFFEAGRSRGVRADQTKRLRQLLTALDSAVMTTT